MLYYKVKHLIKKLLGPKGTLWLKRLVRPSVIYDDGDQRPAPGGVDVWQVEYDGDIRYVPREGNLSSFSGIAHTSRYTWVKHLLRPHFEVLDFGCGSGYGAYEISPHVRHCDAIDISKVAIEYARKTFKRDNLEFHNTDLAGKLHLNRKYDFIVSFDVIEHVRDYSAFLKNASALLVDNGTFVCGTPNRLETLNWNAGWNPYHTKEFSPEELEETLGRYFGKVQLSGQDIREARKKSAVQKALAKKRTLWTRLKEILNSPAGMQQAQSGLPPLSSDDITFEGNIRGSFGLIAVCSEPIGPLE